MVQCLCWWENPQKSREDFVQMINNSLREIISLTKEQRLELLYKAKILDEDGCYHPDFFSEETIRKDKERKQITE